MCRNPYTADWKGKRAPVAFWAIGKTTKTLQMEHSQRQGRHGARSIQQQEWIDDSVEIWNWRSYKDAYSEEDVEVVKEVLDLMITKTLD